MKAKVLTILFIPFLFATNQASAQQAPLRAHEGSGVRGGGEAVVKEDNAVLRDLIDKGVCHYESGERFMQSLSAFPAVMDSLRKVHWLLADAMEDYGKDLTICKLDTEIEKVPATGDITIFEYETKQAAIRSNDRVYLSMPVFAKMDPLNQAYLYVHEVMHSFIPMDTPERMLKLKTMVSVIRENQLETAKPDYFGEQLRLNDVSILQNVDGLDADLRSELEKALDRTAPDAERQIAALNARWDLRHLGTIQQPKPDAFAGALKTLAWKIQELAKPVLEKIKDALSKGNEVGVLEWLKSGVRPTVELSAGWQSIDEQRNFSSLLGQVFANHMMNALGEIQQAYGIDPNFRIKDEGWSETLLAFAIKYGNKDLAEFFLGIPGFDVNARIIEKDEYGKEGRATYPILELIKNNDTYYNDATLDLVLSRKDLNLAVKDENGNAAVALAIFKRKAAAVSQLLAAGADVNAIAANDRTPLMLEADYWHYPEPKIHTAILNALMGAPGLQINTEACNLYCESGQSAEWIYEPIQHATALHVAVNAGDVEQVKLLLARPDIDEKAVAFFDLEHKRSWMTARQIAEYGVKKWRYGYSGEGEDPKVRFDAAIKLLKAYEKSHKPK